MNEMSTTTIKVVLVCYNTCEITNCINFHLVTTVCADLLHFRLSGLSVTFTFTESGPTPELPSINYLIYCVLSVTSPNRRTSSF